MKIKDKAKPKQPPIPPNLYAGICVGVIDLGEQYSEMFKSYSNKVMLVWELPGFTVEVDGKQEPRQLSRTYTFSANKKSALRKLLSSWNGVQYSDEQFNELDLFTQLGKPCFINVTLSDNQEYNNVDSVTPPMQGYTIPQATTPFMKWDMDEWNDAAFEALPEWAKDKIKKSTQYQKAHPPTTTIDFAALSGAQAQQPAAPAVQPAQPVQQYAAPVVQQAAPVAQPAQVVQQPAPVQEAAPQVTQQPVQPAQTSQAVYTSAPAAPGAMNQQAYQIPYQGAAQQPVVTQAAPVAQPQQPIVQQGANTDSVPF